MDQKQSRTEPGVFRVYRWLRFVLIPLILLIFGFSVWQLVRIYTEYQKGEDAYRSVGEQYVSPSETNDPGTNAAVSEETVQTPRPFAEQTLQQDETASPITEQVSFEPTATDSTAGYVQIRETPAPTEGASTEEPDETPAPTEGASTEEPDETPAPERAPITVDFAGLREMNAECVGWIYIPDTTVNYPVMRAENNSKYLYILPDGTKNKSGSIFMDFRNDPGLTDGNTIIYGHRLESGGMFTPLLQYQKRVFFDSHRTAYYLTPDGDYRLDVVACATISVLGDAYELFDDPALLRAHLKELTESAHAVGMFDLDRVDRIITLSTCTGKNGTRIVVICIPEKLG